MPQTTSNSTEDSIRAIAYGLWVAEGRPDGRAEAHWLKANELASSETNTPPVPKKSAAPAKKPTRRKGS